MAPIGAGQDDFVAMSAGGAVVTLRRLRTASDAAAAAELYLLARHAAVPAIPALVHCDDAVRVWFHTVVMPELQAWLAECDGQLVGVMVLDGDELDQLYVHPSWLGRGVGGQLVRLAQRERPDGLCLWTFEANRRAQSFYERHGFRVAARTDGSNSEERSPDIRYTWTPAPDTDLRQRTSPLAVSAGTPRPGSRPL